MNILKSILFVIDILFGILYITFALSKISEDGGKMFGWIAGIIIIMNAATLI